ncbi:hypothetical protein BH24CHL6_BH24CHL6_12930 [soil metagenome]
MMKCPWCEEEVPVPRADQASEQTCPHCLTTWAFVTEEPDLAQAA